MAIDPSIPLQAQAPPRPSPAEIMGQVLAIQRANQQKQVTDLELTEKRRQMAAEDAYNNAISFGINPDGTVNPTVFAEKVKGTAAAGKLPAFLKSLDEQAKARAEVMEARQKVAKGEADEMGRIAAGAEVWDDPEDRAFALVTGIRAGVNGGSIPEQHGLDTIKSFIGAEGRPDPLLVNQTIARLKQQSEEREKLKSERMNAQANTDEATVAKDRLNLQRKGLVAESTMKEQEAAFMRNGISAKDQAQIDRETKANQETARHNKEEEAIARKRLSLSGGSAEDGETVAYWVRQIKNDPTQWNMLANNKPLQNAVQKGLAQTGTDLTKLTAQSRGMAETAKEILPHIATIQSEAEQIDKLGLMGPVQGRWRDFVAGRIGSGELAGGNAANAKLLGKFQTDLGLLMTGVARAHGGARAGGSPAMVQHMKSIMDAAGKDLPTFLGNLASAKEWMAGYAGMVPTNMANTTTPTKKTAEELIKQYGR